MGKYLIAQVTDRETGELVKSCIYEKIHTGRRIVGKVWKTKDDIFTRMTITKDSRYSDALVIADVAHMYSCLNVSPINERFEFQHVGYEQLQEIENTGTILRNRKSA
jgi:hypothetical protein